LKGIYYAKFVETSLSLYILISEETCPKGMHHKEWIFLDLGSMFEGSLFFQICWYLQLSLYEKTCHIVGKNHKENETMVDILMLCLPHNEPHPTGIICISLLQ
jgi:hypothetical protein